MELKVIEPKTFFFLKHTKLLNAGNSSEFNGEHFIEH